MVATESERSAALVRDAIYRASLELDAKDFASWLERCAPEFSYEIRAYSPEIRRDVTFLRHDLAGIRNMVELLPKHQSDAAPLTRHVSVYAVTPRADGDFDAFSSVIVLRTLLDGGTTSIFAAGKYEDVVRVDADGAVSFVSRLVRLDTRELGMGTHLPL